MAENLDLQFAHVLFLDIVGYSTRDHAEQRRLIEDLQQHVRALPEYHRSGAEGDLLCIPTGDGMALVFFREPVAPLQAAVQIAKTLRGNETLQLRMGIHSGPVYRVEDINTNANVSGGGINTAQRVMDVGDAGHVLVSAAVAELVRQVGAWPLMDLGECEVKHGQRLHLFNVCGADFGNPAPPSRLKRPAASTRKIVFLYRRDAQPDEEVLEALATRFAQEGCEVFWDRHLKVGMKWAEEIRRRIEEADAVIPLVSASSMHSEMLSEELQMARQAAETQGGRPRILPVRIRYSGAYPEGVAIVLDPIEAARWEATGDTERLQKDLLEGLDAPIQETRPSASRTPAVLPHTAPSAPSADAKSTPAPGELEATGGAVPLNSQYYVSRASDHTFLTAIQRRDSIVLVNGARQMGKTSLLARALQQARQQGARVVLTDFQWLGAEQLESADTLFRALGEMMADQLDLDTFPDDVWNPRSGAPVNFQRYIRRAVLGADTSPVIWGLDEVDRLFTCPYGSEVFGLFRSWHNARALDPSGPWSQLTLAIAYATEAHLFITDVNQSPFNVGTRVTLSDFSLEETTELNRRHGEPLTSSAELARFQRLVNGHPYLTRRGINEIVSQHLSLAAFEEAALANEGPFGDHLRRILVLLARNRELSEVMRSVLRGHGCPTPESFYRLRSGGLVKGETPREAQPRCQLYASYLERHLL
jgi:class 3 adenylate cyclase